MDVSLSTRKVLDHAVLEVGGEVDVFTAPRLKDELAALARAGERNVVVELSGVGFLDSAGLGVLVGAHQRLSAGGGALSIACPEDRLPRIFRIPGLDNVLAIHPSVEAAIGAIGQEQRSVAPTQV